MLTGPDGEFIARLPDGTEATPEQGQLIAGDCARRFRAGVAAGDGSDPFSDLRRTPWVGPWPDSHQEAADSEAP